jgi:hypothetical protein
VTSTSASGGDDREGSFGTTSSNYDVYSTVQTQIYVAVNGGRVKVARRFICR